MRNHFNSSSHQHPGPSPGTSDHRKSFTTVIGEVLLDQTKTTRLMGKPSDSDKTKSAWEWAGLLVNTTCAECTQNTTQVLFRIRTHDIFVYQIVLLLSAIRDTTTGWKHHQVLVSSVMMSAQALFTLWVSGCVTLPSIEMTRHTPRSPISQTSRVLVVV